VNSWLDVVDGYPHHDRADKSTVIYLVPVGNHPAVADPIGKARGWFQYVMEGA
jgi:hypothetical protein